MGGVIGSVVGGTIGKKVSGEIFDIRIRKNANFVETFFFFRNSGKLIDRFLSDHNYDQYNNIEQYQ